MTTEPTRALATATGPWDAIVVGGGHNGLVCAAYLARAGLRTVVLEARDTVGGAIATTELVPGVRVPTYAHTVGRLRGSIARDLGLAANGLRLVQPRARVTSVRPEGPAITLWGDPVATARSLAVVSRHDADAWVAADAEVRALAGVLSRIAALTPPDPSTPVAGDALELLRLALHLRGMDERHARALTQVLPQSVADFVTDRFESEPLRAMVAVRGVRYTSMGPLSASSTWVVPADRGPIDV